MGLTQENAKNEDQASMPAECTDGDQSPIQQDGKKTPGSGDEEAKENVINIGKDYQATPPVWVPLEHRRLHQSLERALLVWSPNPLIPEEKMDKYIKVSKEKYGYNEEQALGVLFWNKHDIDNAVKDLAKYEQFPDEWTAEDKSQFELAFQYHWPIGKRFLEIREMMPDKSIAQLVNYYYRVHKYKEKRNSQMDVQDRIVQEARENHGYDKGIDAILSACESFNISTASAEKVNKKILPPQGISIDRDDLMVLATGTYSQSEQFIKSSTREIESYNSLSQGNKQSLSSLKEKVEARSAKEPLQSPMEITSVINPQWSKEEHLLGVEGIRTLGENFAAIADVIGNKTEAHVRSFFITNKRRYNLETILNEYKASVEDIFIEGEKKTI